MAILIDSSLNSEKRRNADAVPTTIRRFLSWEEAQKMIAGGMAIGFHTRSFTTCSASCNLISNLWSFPNR